MVKCTHIENQVALKVTFGFLHYNEQTESAKQTGKHGMRFFGEVKENQTREVYK